MRIALYNTSSRYELNKDDYEMFYLGTLYEALDCSFYDRIQIAAKRLKQKSLESYFLCP